MNSISSFLDKFKHLLSSKKSEQETVLKALLNIIGVEIPSKSITIKESKVFISGNPVIRSEIVLKKLLILEEIRKINPESRIVDIH